MRKYQLKLLVFSLIYWNVVIRFAIFMRILGARDHNMTDISKGMTFLVEEITLSSVIISLFATLSWFIFTYIYPRVVRSLRMRRLAIGVVILDVIVFIGISILLGIVHYAVSKNLGFIEAIYHLPKFLFNSTILFFLLVLFVGGYVYHLIITLMHQIGYAPLGKIMMGYYQKPREEELIFMFLDLQSSTSVAETLGHERYSHFIQDCFKCVSSSLLATKGRVYQFVGDEVVINWDASKKMCFKRAVDFYYLYENALKKRQPYFKEEYGMVPIFTASINVGKVMAAEVGEVKRELAFHGDVLNTAARIQKQCKRYKKQILVTREFAVRLVKNTKFYKVEYVDMVKFFGKDNSIKIYEVHKAEE